MGTAGVGPGPGEPAIYTRVATGALTAMVATCWGYLVENLLAVPAELAIFGSVYHLVYCQK